METKQFRENEYQHPLSDAGSAIYSVIDESMMDKCILSALVYFTVGSSHVKLLFQSSTVWALSLSELPLLVNTTIVLRRSQNIWEMLSGENWQ